MNPYNPTIVVPVMPRQDLGQWREPPSPFDAVRYTRAEFDLDKLFESLWKQVRVVWETGAKPTDVLLGRDFYSRFLKECHNRYFQFQVPPQFGARVYPAEFGMVFDGLNVHCIPWMEGVVVTPALTSIPRKRQSTNEWGVNTDSDSVILPATEIPKTAADPGLIRQVLGGLQEGFVAWLHRPNEDMAGFVRPERWWRKP